MTRSLADFARTHPDKPAVIMSDDAETISFGALDAASARLARKLRTTLDDGDRVAILLNNCIAYFPVAWAARRAGLRYVPINWHLQRNETAYIVDNSDAKVIVSTSRLAEIATFAADQGSAVIARYTVDGVFDGFEPLDAGPDAPPIVEREGIPMFYSSGTTGAPKGILNPMPDMPFGHPAKVEPLMEGEYGFGPDTVYLSPAPLYHAAPLSWTMGTTALGGTSVVMRNFDAEGTLAAIERYGVTHAQFVPTHFVRLLKLPAEVRRKYDLSTLKVAIHSAAPCPPDVKQQMLDWWGDCVQEYYGASEGGFARATAAEWRERPGTVGQSRIGEIHILDDNGHELPHGEVGTIFFDGGSTFSFHKAEEKTREHVDPRGWSTPGDLGYVDDDGYLYLADRKSNMIISGGVNIYPREVEDALTLHSAVSDVAVIGIPNADFGEEVKAVIVPTTPPANPAALEAELIAFCRERIARFKCPRSVDFVDSLPRLPTGKLLKRQLIDRYKLQP